MIDDDVRWFLDAVKAPKLERVVGVDPESDADFRERILEACDAIHRPCTHTGSAQQLDVIGKIYGLTRKGFR